MGSPLIVNLTDLDSSNTSGLKKGVSHPFSISSEEDIQIRKDFESCKGSRASMYIISNTTRLPNRSFYPAYSNSSPENVVLRLISKYAKVSSTLLLAWISNATPSQDIPLEILSNLAVKNMANLILTVNKNLLFSSFSSFFEGVPAAQLRLYSNLSSKELSYEHLICTKYVFIQVFLSHGYGNITFFLLL